MTLIRSLFAAALVCAAFSGNQAAAQTKNQPQPPAQDLTSAVGLWEQIDDETGKSSGWFRITEKEDGVYEGAIVKMFPKPGEDPNPICTKCEGEQKNQPGLGLTIIKNMQRKGMKYENGNILDPRDGKVYKAMMELAPDGKKLTVRGYWGISLLGRSQIWNRLPETALAPHEDPTNKEAYNKKPADKPLDRKASNRRQQQ